MRGRSSDGTLHEETLDGKRVAASSLAGLLVRFTQHEISSPCADQADCKAANALVGGVPLAIVGEIRGHRQPNTTKRYAHLANRVVREALEHTAGIIVAATTIPRARPLARRAGVTTGAVTRASTFGQVPSAHHRRRRLSGATGT